MNSQQIKRLPSVELQTYAFYNACLDSGKHQEIDLSWNGFHVHLSFYIRSRNGFPEPMLVIEDAYIPWRYRHRGWFTHYCLMCDMITNSNLIIDVELPLAVKQRLLNQGFDEEEIIYRWLIG